MKNTISERVADFLKQFPPFTMLETDQLNLLSEQIHIHYKEKEAVIFKREANPHNFFYVVHKGAVALYRDKEILIDLCDEGDIFGLRPLLANDNYKLEAKAHEESIIYAIPLAIFKSFVLENKQLGDFLIKSFASNTRNPYSKDHRGKLYDESPQDNIEAYDDASTLRRIPFSKKIISCSPGTSVQELAKTMTKKKVGSIIIVENNLPIGIITDTDIREKIATGLFSITDLASEIMTSPVITYPKSITIEQAQMAMMKFRIDHLCLTQDGTPNSEITGILAQEDIKVFLGNSPAALIKAIRRSKKNKNIKRLQTNIRHLLKEYLRQNIPITLTSKIIFELNDASIKRVIELAILKMDEAAPVPFSWLALGSQGRAEQFIQTDQDNALIYEDVSPEKEASTKAYFLQLAKRINKGLYTIGYEYCPAEMMASNSKYCQSISEWEKDFEYWIQNPGTEEILKFSIFFDYSLSYGDAKMVVKLSDHIFKKVKEYPLFFSHLAKGALQSPSPTGFFRQLIVEQNGANKDSFDVKHRGLMPLTDAARLLILHHAVKGINNTAARFEKLAELEPNNRTLFLSCSYATKALLKFRTKQGVANNTSGRFISLKELSKEDKMKLKRTFKTIKNLQDLITIRFQVKTIL